jgi:hypothetical protein
VADMSHTIKITADLNRVRQAAMAMKSTASASSVEEIERNPKQYLARLGVEIDDETASAIKNRLGKRSATAAAAAIIHVDV